jgi:PAS domain S-box-containing protein
MLGNLIRFSIFAAGGAVVGLLAAAQRRRELKLIECREQLTAVLRNLPGPAWVKDLEGRYIYANPEAERNFGRSLEHLRGKTDEGLFPPQTAQMFRKNDRRVLTEGVCMQFTEVLRHPDGVDHYSIVNKFPLIGSGGQPAYIAGVGFDITELKHAEEALRLSEEKFAKIFAMNPAAIVISRAGDGLILEANEACLAIFGYNPHEVIGRPALTLDVWPTLEARVHYVEELRKRGSLRNWEQTMLKRSGEPFVALSSAEILVVSGEQLILSSWLDISDRKLAEIKMHELNELLEERTAQRTIEMQRQADQLRALVTELTQTEQRERQRLAKILHEHIQQLLVVARWRIGVIVNRPLDEDLATSALVVNDIIDEILSDLRTLTAELSPPVLYSLGLGPALEWLSGAFLEKYGLEVAVTFESSAEPDDENVRIFMFNAIREILFNTVKHSGTMKAHVEVLSNPDFSMRVLVSDEGIGFDRGQLHSAEIRRGLGLFGIQQRLRHMGGQMEINSAPGEGVRITLIGPRPQGI